ncbi:GFA family protein [Haliea sp. E1-2-M8]|uniref:GFA family protein n=1 Tax=Haliea sp. E1-2-M8 TaxID=3064706 RepID=UPI00351C0803
MACAGSGKGGQLIWSRKLPADIRYEVEIIPEQIFNCHCRFCRKAHGADYATVAFAKASTLKLMDEKGFRCDKSHEAGVISLLKAELDWNSSTREEAIDAFRNALL